MIIISQTALCFNYILNFAVFFREKLKGTLSTEQLGAFLLWVNYINKKMNLPTVAAAYNQVQAPRAEISIVQTSFVIIS